MNFDKDISDLLEPAPMEIKNTAGFFLCIEGSAEIFLNGNLYRISPGILYIISPFIAITYINKTDNFRGVSIYDSLDLFYAVIRNVVNILVTLRLINNPCIQLTDSELEFIITRKRMLVEKIALAESAPEIKKELYKSMYTLIAQETMLELIDIFQSNRSVESVTINRNFEIVYHFMESLNRNHHKQRSVTFYASEANLSTGRFTSIIKEVMGRCPSEIIVDAVITDAKIQLKNNELSIKEIASNLNFPEQFTFRKYFKHYVGIPPKEYRKSLP